MKHATPIIRIASVAGVVWLFLLTVGELKLQVELPSVAGQTPVLLPGQISPDDVDMTPSEQSAEVRELLRGTTFVPDPGEPAGAIQAYFTTQEKVRKALRRIEQGPLPGEVDFDPDQLLNEALAMRQRATALYPTSRHAWQGLGELLLWQQYMRQHRSSDLRRAVEAYIKAADILTPRIQQGVGSGNAGDFTTAVRAIANGFAALADTAALDVFFGKLQGTKAWPLARLAYAVALGALNDQRADQLLQEELGLMSPGETLLEYVDYLWDRGRYQDALRVLDVKDHTSLHVILHVQRGAILERLGCLDEARAEYQQYIGETAKRSKSPWPWPLLVSDRYRITGSTLQHNIKFYPSLERLPKPQSGLRRLLSPAAAWADHVSTPCDSGDWNCKAYWYLVRTIHGSTRSQVAGGQLEGRELWRGM